MNPLNFLYYCLYLFASKMIVAEWQSSVPMRAKAFLSICLLFNFGTVIGFLKLDTYLGAHCPRYLFLLAIGTGFLVLYVYLSRNGNDTKIVNYYSNARSMHATKDLWIGVAYYVLSFVVLILMTIF